MRIALISPFHPLRGGIARFSGLLARAIEREGHEVLAVSYRKLYPRWITRGRSSGDPGTASAERQAFFELDLTAPRTWFDTARQLRKANPDILLVAYWTAVQAPLCFVLRRVSRLKTVILLHNFTSHEAIPGERFLKRMLVASADGFLTLSGAVHRELTAFSPSAAALQLFHPVYEPQGELPSRQEARRSLGLAEDAKVLLFFGYVREYKGLDLLLEALEAVAEEEPSVRLLVAGEFYQDEEPFRQQAVRLGLSSKVDFLPGYVPADRVPFLFAASDAVVLPYRKASQSGVVQLAFGHGVPVIVTDAGGLAEQVEHRRTGWIAAGADCRLLADAILGFFRECDPSGMKGNIEQACRTMSWKAFGERTSGFLNELAEGRCVTVSRE